MQEISTNQPAGGTRLKHFATPEGARIEERLPRNYDAGLLRVPLTAALHGVVPRSAESPA